MAVKTGPDQLPSDPTTPAAPAGGSIFDQLGQGVAAVQGNVNADVARSNATNAAAAAKAATAATAAGSGGAASSAIAAWVDALFQQYLGRPASQTELNTIQAQGWNGVRLRQHLRAQPSYIPGLTMGQYEDTVAASKSEYLKYLGYEPSDADIRDLNQRGIKDQFAVNNYLKNRPDVVALHPGAPIDLADEQYGHWKDQINGHYQQNLQRDATDPEARDAYNNRQTVAPPKPTDIGPGLSFSQTGGLQAKDMLSPSARAQ